MKKKTNNSTILPKNAVPLQRESDKQANNRDKNEAR
jgi:hypothetical protein